MLKIETHFYFQIFTSCTFFLQYYLYWLYLNVMDIYGLYFQFTFIYLMKINWETTQIWHIITTLHNLHESIHMGVLVRVVTIGLYIWMFHSQLMNSLRRIRKFVPVSGAVSLWVCFEKAKAQNRPILSSFYLPLDQDASS